MGKPIKNGVLQTLSVKVKLRAEISREERGMYFSYCPSLDLFSQGESRKEAKDNLIEVIGMIIEAHLERDTFAVWMKKRRFRSPAKIAARTTPRKKSIRKPRPGTEVINITAEFPIAAYC